MNRAAAIIFMLLLVAVSACARAETWSADGPMILMPMDEQQTDHLRAYGVAYWCLEPPRGYKVQWLLNYRGGSFMTPDAQDIRDRATLMGVSYKVIDASAANRIYHDIQGMNAEVVLLEKAPKVAVYVTPGNEPWDDAVRLALDYSKIPYDTVYDREVLAGDLTKYDWLHLHHEDFTGQYGKFYASFRNADWYMQSVQRAESMARDLGFPTVQKLKRAVALGIRAYVESGGFLFAMCSAPDSLDVALAAKDVDIVPPEIDGTPITRGVDEKLQYDESFAFTDFILVKDAMVYEISDIDITPPNVSNPLLVPDFELFEFSAKQDPVLTIFVQNHRTSVHDFLGQTTAFHRDLIRDDVAVLGDTPGTDRVKYIHGNRGAGSFTFLGGHDPEDFAHMVGERPTKMELHKNSPGYRLILNNVLFPAVRHKEKKT
mgnify:CR=1 FL=1